MGKRKVISDKKNPFDFKFNRLKHNVLGRKISGSHGNPTVSCGLAQLKRKTILKKKDKLYRANKFLDQRFVDSSLSKEESSVLRLVRQRQNKLKKNIFNLNEEENLTHLGQSLDQIEDFNKHGIESDEDEPLDADFVRQAHFGGFPGENTKQTHKEILAQLITESKIKKYEKKIEKQKDTDLTEKLDGEWKDLQLIFRGSKKSDPQLVNDLYDQTVQELKFEARATPSQRLISEEELARKENEKRTKLESERIRRMVDEQDNQIESIHTIEHLSADSIYDGMILEEIRSEDEKQNVTSDDDNSEGYHSNHRDNISERKDNRPSFKLDELQKMLNSVTETYSEHTVLTFQSMIKECVNKKSAYDIFDFLLVQLFALCKKKMINKELITMFFQQLYTLAKKAPIQTAYKILKLLDEQQSKFQETKENKGRNLISFETLVLLNLCSYLYSTSDFRHPVITPAALFMSDIICNTSKKVTYNLIASLFISKLFLKWITFSKRIIPEAITFLNDVLKKINAKKPQNVKENPSFSELNLFLLTEAGNVNVDDTAILSIAIDQLYSYAEIYSKVPSFSEIFCKTQNLCKQLSKNYQPMIFKLIEKLSTKNYLVLKSVTFPYTKPKPLKLFEPSFDSVFSAKDDNKRKIKLSKSISQKIRREEKSLLRDIRRDTQILAAEKLDKQMLADEERNSKVKQIYHQLASQESEYKKALKKKKKL